MFCLPNVFEPSTNIQLMGERGLINWKLSRRGRIFRMSAYRRLCRQRRNQMSVVIGQEHMNWNLMLTDLYASRGSYYQRMNSFNTGEQNHCLFLLITGIPQSSPVEKMLPSVLKIGLENIILDFPKHVAKHLPDCFFVCSFQLGCKALGRVHVFEACFQSGWKTFGIFLNFVLNFFVFFQKLW